jgi:hypothetical protein
VVCNAQAYSLAQRRRLLGTDDRPSVARSARDCFLHNHAWCVAAYRAVLHQAELHQMQHNAAGNIGDVAKSVRA